MGKLVVSISSLVLLAAACPCDVDSEHSARREFYGVGTLIQGGVATVDCTATSGTAVECPGATGASCCGWDLATATGSWVEAVDDRRRADAELPTWVRLHGPAADLIFAVPDLRRAEVGTRELALPVGPWTPDQLDPPDPGVAGARVSGGTDLAGRALRLRIEVHERTGGARTSGDWLATDDFRLNALVAGTLEPADPAAPLSFSLRIVQTRDDYPTFDDTCE